MTTLRRLMCSVVLAFGTFFGVLLSIDYYCDKNAFTNAANWCFNNRYGVFSHSVDTFMLISLVLGPLMVPVLFTLPFSSVVFKSWIKFAAWGAPVVWLILAWLWYETDGNLFGFSDAMITVPILAVVYTWYFMQSLLVVFSARRNEKGKSPLSLWWGIGSTIALVTFSTLAFIIIAMI